MTLALITARFPAGRIVITPRALSELAEEDVLCGLTRHMSADWGDLDEHDRKENEAALEHGFRLFSRYVASSGIVFWIITEHDRSVTTVLLPNDY